VILLAVLVGGVVVAGRSGILPRHDASWIVRRAQEQSERHSFSASGQTRFSCQGRLLPSDVKFTHMRPNRCRIEYLSGPMKGVLIGNDGKNSWRFDPRTGRLVISGNRSCGRPADRLHLLLENHNVSLEGKTRVAGREAYRLVVRPKSSRQVRKRMWMDTRTFVILRHEDYDSHGRLQSSTRFNRILFAKSFPDKLFQPPTGPSIKVAKRAFDSVESLDRLAKEVGFAVRVPGYVPAGYKLDGYRIHDCPCDCPHRSAYIRYSDGLSSISIFESKAGSGCQSKAGCGTSEGSKRACEPKRSDRGEVVSFENKGISYVIVADVDSRELTKIRESLLD